MFSAEARASVWHEIIDLCSKNGHPCFIICEYNEFLDSTDRGNHIISTHGACDFQNFIKNLGLIEISALNGRFNYLVLSLIEEYVRSLICPTGLDNNLSFIKVISPKEG